MKIDFEKYLIIYDDNCFFYTDNAVSLKDAIRLLADYTGDNSHLFSVALTGMEVKEDMIAIYNHFSPYTIEKIYKIQSKVFDNSTHSEEVIKCLNKK